MRRSDDPVEALRLWLEAETRRIGARAMSVSTWDGIPIAQFGLANPYAFARAATFASRGARDAASRELADVDGCPMLLDSGVEIVLASCGAFVPVDGEGHVRRILG